MKVDALPYVATLVCVSVLILVMRLWKGKTLSWGWLGLLMVFLPQAQGLIRPNGAVYVLFGMVSTFIGILIFAFDLTRRGKQMA
jgi:hypothetical protein